MTKLLLALACAVASLAAGAQTTSASFVPSTVSWSLTDLDTNDGIAPFLDTSRSSSFSELLIGQDVGRIIDMGSSLTGRGPASAWRQGFEVVDMLFLSPRTAVTFSLATEVGTKGKATAEMRLQAAIGATGFQDTVACSTTNGKACVRSDLLAVTLTNPTGDEASVLYGRSWLLSIGAPSQPAFASERSMAMSMAPIPEPGTVALMLAGLAGLAVLRWRRGADGSKGRAR